MIIGSGFLMHSERGMMVSQELMSSSAILIFLVIVMGAFAAALGVGIHGSASILLNQTEFSAGDVVSGRIRLVVTTCIEHADALRLDLIGREILEYDQKDTHHIKSSDTHGSSHEPHAHPTIHEKLVYNILKEAIVLDVPPRSYDPGEYEFPFDYQLPSCGLVSTFQYKLSTLGELTNLNAYATYELALRVPVTGMFKADICCIVNPIIREDPSLQTPCSVTESKTVNVDYFVFFRRGSCNITGTLKQNVVPLGGTAHVQVLLDNNSARPVAKVSTALRQVVTLNQWNTSRDGSRPPKTTKDVATTSFTGIEPGAKLNEVYAQPIAYDRESSRPMIPTMRSHFLSFEYELKVTGRQSWCWEDPSITFPIVLTTKTVLGV